MSGRLETMWGCGVITLATMLLISSAYSQDEFEPSELEFMSELPVVLTVTRLPQNLLEIPASMTVIDRDMIEVAGATNIPDLLRLAAGVQLAHAGSTRTSVTYHGLSDEWARRLQVLVDGRSVYMPTYGGVEWFDLPLVLEDIDRIEVLRGPNGVSYGANSFKAVVNIITRHGLDTQGSFARLQGGGENYRRAVLRYGGQSGDLSYRLSYEHQADDGFAPVTLEGDTRPTDLKDDKQSDKLVFRGDYRAGVNDYLNLGMGFNQGPRGRGYLATGRTDNWYVDAEPAFEDYNRRQFQQLKWRRIISTTDEFQLNLSHTRSETTGEFETGLISEILDVDPSLVPLVFPGVNDQRLYAGHEYLEERYNLELEHRFQLSDVLRMVWGGEVRHDEVLSHSFLGQAEPIDNQLYRLFAHGEWIAGESYRINLGAMLEHNEMTGTNVSPRLALNRMLAPGHAVRVSYTQAFRNPAMLEEHADYSYRLSSDRSLFAQLWKSAGGLEPEEMTSYELGFMGYLGDRRNHYDFKLFREELRNLITPLEDYSYVQPYAALNNAVQAATFRNGDWADITGAELQLKHQSDEGTVVSMAFSRAHTKGIKSREIYIDLTEQVEDAESYVPDYTFSFLVGHNFISGWRGSMEVYDVHTQRFRDKSRISILNLSLAKAFKVGGKSAQLSLAGHNLNRDYYDFREEDAMERSLYASLELAL